MTTPRGSQFMVAQLLQIREKEAHYLERTTTRLQSQNLDLPWIKSLESRKTRSLLDNLLRAETLGWIESTQNWIELRELRNRLVHECMKSVGDRLDALHQALDGVQVLTATQLCMAAYAQKSLLP